MNKRIKKKYKKIKNKKLVERYPFLLPRNRWTDEVPKDYNYEWTELDDMSKGWRKAFGLQMCEEIRKDLIKYDYLNDFRIAQIKEKFGGLRFYVGAIPRDSEVFEIIKKYEDLSFETCEICGKPAETINDCGWLTTICDSCLSVRENDRIQRRARYERRKRKRDRISN